MAPLLARRSKGGNRGGVGSGSTELAEVLALPAVALKNDDDSGPVTHKSLLGSVFGIQPGQMTP
jgi:hypothetical protein